MADLTGTITVGVSLKGSMAIIDLGSGGIATGSSIAGQIVGGIKGEKGDTGDIGAVGATGAQGIQGVKGDTGLQGNAGTNGINGVDGAAATVTVGTTTTGNAGTSAAVANSGTTGAAVLDFTIPKGDTGLTGLAGSNGTNGTAATIAVGTTTTLAPGSSATVTNVGTSGAATFNFGIPKGADGVGSGDMLKATYDPANVNAQLAADSTVVHKTGDTMSGALSVAITSGATTPITATIDSSTATQPAVLAKNNTNYAQSGNIIKAQMLNASDSGAVVRVENAGTGKNISSANGTTETFSVDKAGVVSGGTYNGNTIGSGSTSGSNTGDETTATIKSKLSITTLSGSNTGDQTTVSGNAGTVTGLTVTAGKTLTALHTITLDGTDATTMTFPTTNDTVAGLAAVQTITGAWSYNDGKLILNGATSGNTTLKSGGTAGSSVITLPVATDTLVGKATTDTLTNKRINKRTNSTTSSATPAINTDTTDEFDITALAVAITSMTSSLTGTPVNGDELWIRIKDNGTARAITWGTSFISSGVATLLATTVISKTHKIKLEYDSAATKWVCMAVDAVGY